MKTEEFALQYRLSEINGWREKNIDYATSLYINEHLSNDEYMVLCNKINIKYDQMTQAAKDKFDSLKS